MQEGAEERIFEIVNAELHSNLYTEDKQMKLREVYTICKKNYENIRMAKEYLLELSDDSKKDEHRMKSLRMEICEANESASEISKIKYLERSAERFLNYIPKNFSEINEKIRYYNKTDRIDELDELVEKVRIIIDFCESIDIKEEPVAIDIKIPEVDNISEFRNIIDDLEFVFTKCPFLQSEARLKFDSFDVGSAWITIALVGSSVATISVVLNNLAAFVDKCIIVRNHYLYTKKQEKLIEELEYEKEAKEMLLNSLSKLYEIEIKNVVSDLEKETNYTIRDEEERSRAELAIDKMGGLIEQGLKIYSSIETEKEVQKLFEPLEMKYISLTDQLKLLEDKKSEDNE